MLLDALLLLFVGLPLIGFWTRWGLCLRPQRRFSINLFGRLAMVILVVLTASMAVGVVQ